MNRCMLAFKSMLCCMHTEWQGPGILPLISMHLQRSRARCRHWRTVLCCRVPTQSGNVQRHSLKDDGQDSGLVLQVRRVLT